MIFSHRHLILFAAISTLTACSHGLPIYDADPSQAQKSGYYRGGEDSTQRRGVGNYVSRKCSRGGWGLPGDCTPPQVAQAPIAVSQAAPIAAPADSDGDGVIDSADQCPNTTKGAQVNPFGCVAAEKVSIRLNVNFPTGSAVVPMSAHEELQRLATILKDNPSIKIRIEGHTDNVGSQAFNRSLSNKRAGSIEAFLESEGANADQVVAKGFGPTQPIAPNTSDSGRAQNRRAVAVVTEQ